MAIQSAGKDAKEMLARVDYLGTVTMLGSVRVLCRTEEARDFLTLAPGPQHPHIPQQSFQRADTREFCSLSPMPTETHH